MRYFNMFLSTMIPDSGPASRWVRWLYWLMILLVLLVGALLRAHHYDTWQDNRHVYFFENEPLLQNGDGYYYLRLARDFRDDKYQSIDELRTVPEHPPRPQPPPLLAVLTAMFSAVTSLSLDWSAVILPVPFSLSLILPVLVLCRQLQIPALPSVAAAAVAVTSQTYVVRTSLGVYDTDSLIVFFSLCASVLALGFGLHRNSVRYLYLLGAALNAGLFIWWWDQAPDAVTLICLIPLLISAVLYYRPQRREGLLAGAGLIGVLLIFLFAFPEAVDKIRYGIREILVHGIKGGTEDFPDVRSDIVELHATGWNGLIHGTTGLSAVFFVCLAGFLWLIWTHPGRTAVALTVPVALALSTFLFGYRALIFWGPPLGLGLAFLVTAVHGLLKHRWPRSGAVIATGIAIAVAVPNIPNQMSRKSPAPISFYLMKSVPSIRENTPQDAIIWTSWTSGYPLMYFTGRRVISDGQFMSGERRVYGNLPLVSSDPNFAHNFIYFYITHGMTGLHRLYRLTGSPRAGLRWIKQKLGGDDPEKAAQDLLTLSRPAGHDAICTSIEACRKFLFPPRSEPVYLLLNHQIFRSKWFWYGTWDPLQRSDRQPPPFKTRWFWYDASDAREVKGKGEAAAILPLFRIKREGGTLVLNKNITIDIEKGKRLELATAGHVFKQPVKQLLTYTGDRLEIKDYGYEEGLHVEWMQHNGFGAIMTENVAESLFNQLFIRHTTSSEHFRHAAIQSPNFSLWEVVSSSP